MTIEDIKPVEKSAAKLSEQRAEEILQELLDYYDIELDDIAIDLGKEGAQTAMNKVKRAIRNGRLEVEPHAEKGMLVKQHTRNTVITYGEISGATKLESDKQKGNNAKVYAILGSLSGLGIEAIKKLQGRDMGLAECIGIIFLAV